MGLLNPLFSVCIAQKYGEPLYFFVKCAETWAQQAPKDWFRPQELFPLPGAEIKLPFRLIRKPHPVANLAIIRCPAMYEQQLRELLNQAPWVERWEKIPPRKFFFTPNDLLPATGNPNQYYMHLCAFPEAWNITRGDSSVIIAITDNGFHLAHPDLHHKWLANSGEIPSDEIDNDNNGYTDDDLGWNAVDNNGQVGADLPGLTHATAVSGLASAHTHNGLGIAGAGFSCRLLPVKISDSSNIPLAGYTGIWFAADRGAHVINCSWGGIIPSFGEQTIVDYALSLGCVVVAAAGNDNDTLPMYPAAYPGVIAVAATTAQDIRYSLSNFGSWVSLCAPGHAVYTCDYNAATQQFTYSYRNGTSMAAPLVAGAAALMKSLYLAAAPALVKQCLQDAADPIDQLPANAPYAGLLGSGRLNAKAALECFRQFIPPKAGVSFADDSTYGRFCADDTVLLMAHSIAGPVDSVQWTPLSGGIQVLTPTTSSTWITFSGPGLYQVQLRVANSFGADTAMLTLEALPRPSDYPSLHRVDNWLICSTSLPHIYWFRNDTLLPWAGDSLLLTQWGKGVYQCGGAAVPGGCRNHSAPLAVDSIIVAKHSEQEGPRLIALADGFWLDHLYGPVQWKIFSVDGRQMAVGYTAYIPVAEFPAGVYMLYINYENRHLLHRFVRY